MFFDLGISKIHQDLTIVKFRFCCLKTLGVARCFGPKKIQNCSTAFNIFPKNDSVGFTYVWRSSTITQDLLRFHHRKFPFCLKTLGETNCFGPKKTFIYCLSPRGISHFYGSQITKNPKFRKAILWFVVDIGTAYAKSHSFFW